MIFNDQPTCFGSSLSVAVSSRRDGSMLDRTVSIHNGYSVENRQIFCDKSLGIDYDDVAYLQIEYGNDKAYNVVEEVNERSTNRYLKGVLADALFTLKPGVAMILPIADCIAMVVYDPAKRMLALAHLGRHSTIANLTESLIDEFILKGSNPKDLVVWMSPSAKFDSYKMQYFDLMDDPRWTQFTKVFHDGILLDLPGYNLSACLRKGLLESNIHISPIDTMKNSNYYSFANGDIKGRFAVVAVMR